MSPRPRNAPAVLPAGLFEDGDFLGSVEPTDLVYWILNVGDGDLQLILLPERESDHSRRAIVVDVGRSGKLPPLLDSLKERDFLKVPEDGQLFPLVIGTHPHDDHISGMPEFLRLWGHAVREYWEPGYWHTSLAYQNTMHLLEDADPHIQHTQPTSGTTRFVGRLKIIVLSPAVGLRRRFDTYGVDLNDSSISLRLEFPASRVEKRNRDRAYVGLRGKTRTLLLGADSLLDSWANVLVDFPVLHPQNAPAAQAIGKAQGPEALDAEIFKVPHHASKHGLNLGLVEAVSPKISLISSVGGGGSTTSRIWSRSRRCGRESSGPRRAARSTSRTGSSRSTTPPKRTPTDRSGRWLSSSRRRAGRSASGASATRRTSRSTWRRRAASRRSSGLVGSRIRR